jgi:isoleucyl-tRNA synthetase
LNVKTIQFDLLKDKDSSEVRLATKVTPELKAEGIARDLIRFVQNARKNAGFNVEDRIQLKITSEDSEITEAAKTHKDTIFNETLATSELTGEGTHTETVKLDGHQIHISVSRNS